MITNNMNIAMIVVIMKKKKINMIATMKEHWDLYKMITTAINNIMNIDTISVNARRTIKSECVIIKWNRDHITLKKTALSKNIKNLNSKKCWITFRVYKRWFRIYKRWMIVASLHHVLGLLSLPPYLLCGVFLLNSCVVGFLLFIFGDGLLQCHYLFIMLQIEILTCPLGAKIFIWDCEQGEGSLVLKDVNLLHVSHIHVCCCLGWSLC